MKHKALASNVRPDVPIAHPTHDFQSHLSRSRWLCCCRVQQYALVKNTFREIALNSGKSYFSVSYGIADELRAKSDNKKPCKCLCASELQ